MKIDDLAKQYVTALEVHYDKEEAENLFNIAATHLLNLNLMQLKLNKSMILTADQQVKFTDILQELKTAKPIQHILGEANFYGLIFHVNSNVLIPRPETEELVDWMISDHKFMASDSTLKILDIGTGSGCIPITLKKHLSFANVTSIDVSAEAIEVATNNAKQLNTYIRFIQADFLTYSSEDKFDIIVSNPPYIRELESEEMHNNVLKHEPHLALFVPDQDPLRFYKSIASFAKTNLMNGGKLYFEINEYLGIEMVKMLSDYGFKNINLKKDMQGKDRMIVAYF